MTRQEFNEQVTDFYDLREFASGHLLSIEILNRDEFECKVEDDIREWLTGDWWWRDEFLELVNECRELQGADWYVRDGAFDYTDISEDFGYYKQKVLELADEDGVFGSDDSDDTDEPATVHFTPAAEA